MLRRVLSFALVLCVLGAVPVRASEGDTGTLPPAPKRPLALSTMYGTYATLQVLDLVTTRKAIGAGAHEANPVMGPGTTGQMIAVKAIGGAASIYFAEKAWKKNRVGAIVLMAALNGATAAIVAHNTRVARR